jgi:hypothetical protein
MFQLLKEALPRLAKVAIVWNPDNLGSVISFKEGELPATKQGGSGRTSRSGQSVCVGCASAATLWGEFGVEARARRRRVRGLMKAAPEIGLWRRATLAGPESVPASAFDERVYETLCGHALPTSLSGGTPADR